MFVITVRIKKGKDHKFQASLGSIAKPYIKQ